MGERALSFSLPYTCFKKTNVPLIIVLTGGEHRSYSHRGREKKSAVDGSKKCEQKALGLGLGHRHGLVRGLKTFSLPDLPYDYSALEPVIMTEFMKLHHEHHGGTQEILQFG